MNRAVYSVCSPSPPPKTTPGRRRPGWGGGGVGPGRRGRPRVEGGGPGPAAGAEQIQPDLGVVPPQRDGEGAQRGGPPGLGRPDDEEHTVLRRWRRRYLPGARSVLDRCSGRTQTKPRKHKPQPPGDDQRQRQRPRQRMTNDRVESRTTLDTIVCVVR